MPFLTAGYPTLDETKQSLPKVEAAGASIVELGFPFSDPIADGPVIAASMYKALQEDVTPHKIFDAVQDVRDSISLGLMAMVSESIVRRMGEENFVDQAADAGIDGLIVPDIDTASGHSLLIQCERRDMSFVLLVAPNSSDERIREVVSMCRGFVYLLARSGLTGERDEAPDVERQVAAVRNATDLPIAVGFGISRAEHVSAVVQHADAAIVGSALVKRMGDADDPAEEASRFVAELAAGLSRKPVA